MAIRGNVNSNVATADEVVNPINWIVDIPPGLVTTRDLPTVTALGLNTQMRLINWSKIYAIRQMTG